MIVPWRVVRIASSSVYVGSSGYTGLQVAGTAGVLVGAVVSVGSLWLALSSSARKRHREYAQEIADAKREGKEAAEDVLLPRAEKAERDAEYWRSLANSLIRGVPQVPPMPPREGE
jgi:hypothetical protein